MKPNIAIDGPAGAGKSTIARMLAEKLGLLYIDTGAMYRALTYYALRCGIDIAESGELARLAEEVDISLDAAPSGEVRVFCGSEDVSREIRKPEVSNLVSQVAKSPHVRRRMVELQRKMAAKGGAIMDGRDIGTYVLPDAALKVFVTASLDERARRRFDDLQDDGYASDLEDLRLDIARRDEIDSSRDISPLRKADDAVLIDTTDLTAKDAVELIAELYWERTQNAL